MLVATVKTASFLITPTIENFLSELYINIRNLTRAQTSSNQFICQAQLGTKTMMLGLPGKYTTNVATGVTVKSIFFVPLQYSLVVVELIAECGKE